MRSSQAGVTMRIGHAAGFEHRAQTFGHPARRRRPAAMNAGVERGLVRGFVPNRGEILLPLGIVRFAVADIEQRHAIRMGRIIAEQAGGGGNSVFGGVVTEIILCRKHDGDQRKLGIFDLETAHREVHDRIAVHFFESVGPLPLADGMDDEKMRGAGDFVLWSEFALEHSLQDAGGIGDEGSG